MAEPKDSRTEIRYNIPKSANDKIHKYKRLLAVARDEKVTAEEALVEILNQFELPEIHDLIKVA